MFRCLNAVKTSYQSHKIATIGIEYSTPNPYFSESGEQLHLHAGRLYNRRVSGTAIFDRPGPGRWWLPGGRTDTPIGNSGPHHLAHPELENKESERVDIEGRLWR